MSLPLDQIIQGDCLEVLATLPGQSVDLIFADPPYNLQLQRELQRPNYSFVDAVTDEWDRFDDMAAYDAFTRDWLLACRRVMKENGGLWVIGSYHNIFRVGAIMMDLGFWIMNTIEWVKTNPMPNFRGTRFTNATETIIWAVKNVRQSHYTFNYNAMKHLNDDKQMRNIWQLPLCTGAERIKIDGKKAHSTQKPEGLLYRVLMAGSNPEDIVLDPFFGTGTTGAVAKKLNRRFIGIEQVPAYIELAKHRIDAIQTLDDPSLLKTENRRKAPRVAFGLLVAAGYIQPGQCVYDVRRQYCAVIKADSHLKLGDFIGSIHKVASTLVGGNANGWDFWHYEDESGALVKIDALRRRYREDHGLI